MISSGSTWRHGRQKHKVAKKESHIWTVTLGLSSAKYPLQQFHVIGLKFWRIGVIIREHGVRNSQQLNVHVWDGPLPYTQAKLTSHREGRVLKYLTDTFQCLIVSYAVDLSEEFYLRLTITFD